MKCLTPKKKKSFIVCDSCHREFLLKRLTKRKVTSEVTKYVIVCPYCKTERRVFYENTRSACIRKILNTDRFLPVDTKTKYISELHKIEKELEARFESGQKA